MSINFHEDYIDDYDDLTSDKATELINKIEEEVRLLGIIIKFENDD